MTGRLPAALAGRAGGQSRDNICTKDLLTTCSSKILSNFVPPYSAQAVDNLKAAGAVIVGKTNMDEFAMGSTTETSAYGVTRNPWNTEHVPEVPPADHVRRLLPARCRMHSDRIRADRSASRDLFVE